MEIKLELHKTGNLLLLEEQDIYGFVSENTKKEIDLAMFLGKVIEFLNYPLLHNTEMSFDDGYYKELSGWINGFSYAHHITFDEIGSVENITFSKFRITVPKPFAI